MTVTHVMLDLETWGTTPGCDIRSIGACVFDPVTGEVSIPCQTCKGGTMRGNVNDGGDCSDCMNTRMERGYGDTFYLATDNPRGYWGNGSSRDRFFETGKPTDRLKYSLKRDPNTIKWWADQSAEAQAEFENPVDLHDGLARFGDWLETVGNLSVNRIWSHGAATDGPWLAAAYEAVGLPIPWHYRAPRDTRTCFDMAGIDDHSAWLAQHPGPLGVPHHALDDAICQARAVCAAYRRVQSPDREFHVGRIAMQQYADWTNQHTDIGGAWYKIEQAINEGAQ